MKIVCDQCGGTVAHQIGDSLIEAVRQGHKMSVVGKDYSVILSCPNTGKCSNKIAITVENGKVLLDNLKRKENDEKDEKSDEGSGNGDANSGDTGSGDGSTNDGGKDATGPGKSDSGNSDGGEGGDDDKKSDDKSEDDEGGEAGKPPESRKYTKL